MTLIKMLWTAVQVAALLVSISLLLYWLFDLRNRTPERPEGGEEEADGRREAA
jgi:hypothetical protein